MIATALASGLSGEFLKDELMKDIDISIDNGLYQLS
jgi:hypothetical protein